MTITKNQNCISMRSLQLDSSFSSDNSSLGLIENVKLYKRMEKERMVLLAKIFKEIYG